MTQRPTTTCPACGDCSTYASSDYFCPVCQGTGHVEVSGYTLTPEQFYATCEKFTKINERAAKKGLAGQVALKVLRREMVETEPNSGVYEEQVEVLITGTAPKFGGWTFAARVDSVGDSFTLATHPGVEYVSRDGIEPGKCDHCGLARDRRTTYVLVNEDGKQVQVGSTCIKDFLGWSGHIAWLEGKSVEPEMGAGYAPAPAYKTHRVLTLAVAAIREYGFVKSGFEGATRDLVWLALNVHRLKSDKDLAAARALLHAVTTDDEERASKVQEYLVSDEFAGESSYVDNLKVLAHVEFITDRPLSLLVSAPQAYSRHLGEVAKREARRASEWIAQPGEKVTVTGQVTKVSNQGAYTYGANDTYLVVLVTEDGDEVKTFTTAQWSREVEEGDKVTLTATVKQHLEWNGNQSTQITRAKKIA